MQRLYVLALLVCAAPAFAQSVTILDPVTGQPHDVAPNQLQLVGPHPGIIDTDHFHAQNNQFVIDVNGQVVNDVFCDPNGVGFQLAPIPLAPQGEVVSEGLFNAGIVRLGFGVLVIKGAGDDVNALGFVVDSHTGPLDLSVFGFTPEALGVADDQSIHESSGGK